ncbi:Protein kinase domain-containing protein [Heracleum sosnowskyi]|uniref:Protein kinase domain-containing protein n=1 Tax=Heracleum sosnowskyi TaxID=360622 RepID=A0AAD8LZW8_9APIA|nr:Protein kinase domain-containing protein [Heracleum sosnowskyi]
MDLAKSGKISESFSVPCNCFKVAGLTETILESTRVSNFKDRDLKPENILLATKSSSSPIKLADFGLATYIRPGEYLYGTVGSPFYIAPEVLAGGYNQAADVWSAGVILYILLSGVPPFWGKTKSKIFDAVRAADLRFSSDLWDHISVSAKDLISGMLCVDPSKRLTAKQVLAHSWLRDSLHANEDQLKQLNLNYGQVEATTGCLLNPQLAVNQDYCCSDASPAVVDKNLESSPVFTCKSSFSSFLIDQRTPCSISGGFSFSSSYEPNVPDFSSPIPTMPSFTFFSPCSTFQQSNNSLACEGKLPISDKDSGVPKFMLPDLENEFGEMEHRIERQRGEWKSEPMPTSSRSKRNRTIGLGELDPIDLIVTESVIRWASCTHIVGSSSLRSSLVC